MFTDAELGLQSTVYYQDRLRFFDNAATQAQEQGDQISYADAIFNAGYLYDKLRNFSQGTHLIHQAIQLYNNANDYRRASKGYQALAVLTFHTGSSDEAIGFFDKACHLREELKDHIQCARSLHNRAYVLCRLGQVQRAFDSYAKAEHQLELGCAAGQAPLVTSVNEHMNTGFIRSHIAFAHAKFTGHAAALQGATRYFDHFARTRIHREHLLVYLAIGLVLSEGASQNNLIELQQITQFTGLLPEPESYFQFVLNNTDHTTYLGTVVLGLLEFGRYLVKRGKRSQGIEMLHKAVQLCIERRWPGEATRAMRFVQECE